MKRIFIGAILTSISIVSFAQISGTDQTTPSPTAPASAHIADGLCPHVAELQKNPAKGNWKAQTTAGFWKSYNFSFATNIEKFIGAQWTGEEVGQLTCVYSSEQRFDAENNQKIQQTLPVLLVFHSLVFQPVGGKWKHTGVGVHDCNTVTQSDCPFKLHVKAPVENIIQEAESLKSDNSNRLEVPIN